MVESTKWWQCAIVVLALCLVASAGRAEDPLALPDVPAHIAVATPQLCRCQGETSASVMRINDVLAEPLKETGLDFTEEPLEHVVNFLQEEYKIPIQMDLPALEDAGLTADQPTTCQLQNLPLKSALQLLLRAKHLTYVIRDDVLVISTPEEAEAELTICVYDVRDLVGSDRSIKDIRQLVNVILSCIASETWAAHKGGEAEIKTLEPGLLVIAQTRSVHEEIGDLLSLIRMTLRDTKEARGSTIQPARARERDATEPTPAESKQPAADPFD